MGWIKKKKTFHATVPVRENSRSLSSHEYLVTFRGTFAHLLHAWLALPAVISILFGCIATALFLFWSGFDDV
jgi:hypothetical protein